MALLYPSKPAFVSGKLSPRLLGRIDLEQYAVGLQECTNFVVFPHGGATFRQGTRFVHEVRNHEDFVRLLPFIFNNEQAYVLEVGPEYIRIFFNQAFVEDPLDPPNPIELVTPYEQDDIDKIRFDQSGDIMYTVLRRVRPQEIRRMDHDDWDVVPFDFQDGPYLDVNTTSTTLNPSASTGAITITASSTTGINNDQGFLATDVGRLIRLQHAGTWGWVEITAVTSTTLVSATVRGTLGGTTAVTTWRLGAWSDTTGWPEAVQFHQQRLFFARGQFIWGSKTGEFDVFSPSETDGEVLDDNGVTYRLAAGRIDLIQWLSSSRVLEVGSAGAEFTVTGGGNFGLDSPLTPDAVLARKTTENGSFIVSQPIFSSRGTVFINRSGRKLLNYYYSFENDNYVTDDITLLAEEITFPQVFELAYQSEPDLLIWALRSDGLLLSCTFNPTQDVVAWHEHVLGGEFQGSFPVVESVTVIPSTIDTHDEVWVSVLREIDGQEVRYIEVFEHLFTPVDFIESAMFMDSALSYDGPPESVFSGLEHLEGQEVAILTDGVVHPNRIVENGEIELDYEASIVHVGLPFTGRIELLPLEPGDTSNALTSRRSRVVSIGVLFHDTVLAEVGVVGSPLELFNGRITTDPLGEPLQPRTGFMRVPVESNSEHRNRITVVQNNPLPCTILAVLPIIDQ
jgi:hypothetical protein